MGPLLLKHLATSLTRQVTHLRNLTFSSPAASAYRYLSTLTTAPRMMLPSSARISSIQPPAYGPSSHSASSLFGRCQCLTCVQPSAGMKVKSALRMRCRDCFFVRRRGRLHVDCKTNPRHKQRQG